MMTPTREADGRLSVADDEVPGINNYYWQASNDYLSNKLYSYGGTVTIYIYYVVLRGDVSGYYTDEPDIVLEGGPKSLRIGYKWHKPSEESKNNLTVSFPLREQQWFRVSPTGKVTDTPVTREEFTLILYDLKRMLIRAKFHTDQIEGGLYGTDMQKASNTTRPPKYMEGAEMCDCPPGLCYFTVSGEKL